MAKFKIKVEQLIQEVGFVYIESESIQDALTQALDSKILNDVEFEYECHGSKAYIYSVEDEAAGFKSNMRDYRSDVPWIVKVSGLEGVKLAIDTEYQKHLLTQETPETLPERENNLL